MGRKHRRTALVALAASVATATSAVMACSSFGADPGADEDAGLNARAESGAIGDAGAPDGFCANHVDATVCTDFDTTNSFSPWMPRTPEGGSLKQSSVQFVSPPHSMFSAVASTQITEGRLLYDVPADTQRARLGFDVKIASTLTGDASATSYPQVSLAEFYCLESGQSDGIFLFFDDASGVLHAITSSPDASSGLDTALIPLRDVWTRIVIDATFADVQSVRITIGSTTLSAPFSATCSAASLFQARIGLSTNSGVSRSAFFDNVLLETNPKD